jgi:hypothetical protein
MGSGPAYHEDDPPSSEYPGPVGADEALVTYSPASRPWTALSILPWERTGRSATGPVANPWLDPARGRKKEY